MGFLEWLTGRDENASEIAGEDDSKVKNVIDELNNIASESGEVGTAKDNVKAAIDALTSVHGVSELTNSSINPESYTSVFDDIGTSIKKISRNLKSAAKTIGEYNKNKKEHPFETTFGTAGMAGLKVLEGGVSLIEDLGDGVTSIIGWAAPEGSDLENLAKDVTKANWSNDIFKGAYNALDKYSAFTQDSGAASAFKVVGQTVSTIALGGALAGVADGLNAAGKFTKVAPLLQKIGSSTTLSNTLVAGISGRGSGTESALQQGASMDEAFRSGAVQGAIQGGLAFAGGKVSEQAQKVARIKGLQNVIDDLNNKGLSTQAENVKGVQEALKKTSSGSMFQGYHDPLTRRAYNSGFEIGNGIKDFGGATRDFITLSGAEQARRFSVVQNVKTNASLSNTINRLGTSSTQSSTGLSFPNETINRLGASSTQSSTGLSFPNKTIGQITSDETASRIAASLDKARVASEGVDVLGIVAADVVKEANAADGAAAQFRRSSGVDNIKPPDKIETKKKLKIDPENSTGGGPTGGGPNGGGPNGGGSTGGGPTGGGPTGGGPTGGGPNGGGSTGGSSTGGSSNTTAHAQFRKSGDGDSTSSTTASPSTTSTTVPPSTTSTTAPPSTTSTTAPTSTTSTTASPSTTSTTAPTPSTSQTTSTTILTPKNNSNSSSSEQVHTGGGYSSSSGYTGTGDYNSDTSNATPSTPSTPETMAPGNTSKLSDEELTSIKNVIDNSKIHTTTIPKSNTPISSDTKSGGGGSSVIPISAGLTAAAAAGLGAKAYLDRKNNNDNGSSDEINTDEWTGDESVDIKYDDSSDNQEGNTLDADDDYSYQPAEETEKYDAKANNELMDLQ